MRPVEAPCPACGAPVTFKTASSLVTICEYCHSAVARTDRKLEDLGKVAALAPTESPFELEQRGRFREHPFEIVGHVQYQHPAGGTWNEWYAAFPNDKWLWLAEAQGKTYATQEKRLPSDLAVPAFESLSAGQSIDLGSHGTWLVAEVNEATVAGAAGELPYVLRPGAPHRFADLTSGDRVFGTLDFSGERPRFFAGREITLAELGLAGAPPQSEPVVTAAVALNCPKCGGSLSLHAPDEAQRVTCPFCSAMLDVNEGELKYLFTLGKNKVEPLLPLGREGTLGGVKYTLIGFMRRAVKFDREYTWDEYLLYAPKVGFRWLVNSDSHWSFVEPLTLADLANRPGSVTYHDRTFKIFQRAWARVKWVTGEFYWKVSFDETVIAEDYIAPPQMITIEKTPTALVPKENRNHQGFNLATYSEVNVSLGTYVSHETVEQAFGVTDLPRGWAVAPNQPVPGPTSIYYYWGAFLVLLLVIEMVLSVALKGPVDHGFAVIAAVLISIVPVGMAVYNHQFNVRRWEDSEYSPYSSDDDDD